MLRCRIPGSRTILTVCEILIALRAEEARLSILSPALSIRARKKRWRRPQLTSVLSSREDTDDDEDESEDGDDDAADDDNSIDPERREKFAELCARNTSLRATPSKRKAAAILARRKRF